MGEAFESVKATICLQRPTAPRHRIRVPPAPSEPTAVSPSFGTADRRAAVLLSAHGTVDDVADIPAFLANIRRGRPTPDSIVNEVTHRFERIGGSPLLRITREQAAGLEATLGVPVFVGMRLWRPTFDEVLDVIVERGITDVVSLPLAPQSVQIYHGALHEAADRRRAAGKTTPRITEAPAWGESETFLRCLSACVREGIAKLPEAHRANALVVLSAHSLPLRIVRGGDPYETQFRALAESLIAYEKARGATQSFVIAFQSQGMDGGEWLGPDLEATYAQARADGYAALVIAPIGFVSDHVETLYDLDIEAVERATAAGLVFARAPAPNASPAFIEALASVARPLLDHDVNVRAT
jgi:ferrochelatase